MAGNFLSPDLTQARRAAVVKSGFTDPAGARQRPRPRSPRRRRAAWPRTTPTTRRRFRAVGSTGTRAFATDEQGTIWQNNAVANPTPAPTQPFTVAANVTPIQ